MPSLGTTSTELRRLKPVCEARDREERKKRVMSLVTEALPLPQGRIFELVRRLSQPVMDLREVTAIICADPSLQGKILGLLSSSDCEEYQQPLAVSDAVVLLGSERLRILVLGCALADFAGRHLPAETLRAFWQHSILTGLLSQRIAREVLREEVEKAYWGGLLHDIGRLPLLIVAHEQSQRGQRISGAVFDHPELERSYFGVDHCEIGRWIARSGNFPSWMSDVIECHHDQAQAGDHAALVATIAAADRCLPPMQENSRADAETPDWSAAYGDLISGMRPRRLMEQYEAAQSRFLQDSAAHSPFPCFGFC